MTTDMSGGPGAFRRLMNKVAKDLATTPIVHQKTRYAKCAMRHKSHLKQEKWNTLSEDVWYIPAQ